MAKVKLNIEIEEKAYEDLKKKISEMKATFPMPVPFLDSVEAYVAHMVEAMGALGDSMGNFKDLLSKASSMFGNFDINDFKDEDDKKTDDKKKEDDKKLD